MGPNGCGKSTLLKLMTGALDPRDGMVKRHNHLRIGQYHQHLTELLPLDMSPLAYMVRRTGGRRSAVEERRCAASSLCSSEGLAMLWQQQQQSRASLGRARRLTGVLLCLPPTPPRSVLPTSARVWAGLAC